MANGNHGNEFLQPFADAVSRATAGTVTIELKDQVRRDDPMGETKLIDDVVKDEYDLGWAAPRPWHDRGITTFDALMAPFLIDTYALEVAVLKGELEDQMLAGLEGSGLVGLGIAPGPLRRLATDGIIVDGPGSLAGKLVAINESAIARMTFERLGATTVSISGGGPVGDADAIEQQLDSIFGNRYHRDLRDIFVDLALWPRPLIVFANGSAFEALSDDQRAGIRAAAEQFASASLNAAEAGDATALADLCADGARLALAGAEARAALRASVQPVYDELAQDDTTNAMIQRIAALKAETPAPAATGTCAAPDASPSIAARGGFPDGIYEARVSCAEAEASTAGQSLPPDWSQIPCPFVAGFTLDGDGWTENYGLEWKFSFFGDHVQLGNFTMRWTFDGRQVKFSEIVGGGPDDALVWTTKPFTKLDKPSTPAVGFADGTYVARITADEMRTFWEANNIPVELRDECPCEFQISLEGDVLTGNGHAWKATFVDNRLTLVDGQEKLTLRWHFDPFFEELTFSDVEGGIDLRLFFTVKAFDRVN